MLWLRSIASVSVRMKSKLLCVTSIAPSFTLRSPAWMRSDGLVPAVLTINLFWCWLHKNNCLHAPGFGRMRCIGL